MSVVLPRHPGALPVTRTGTELADYCDHLAILLGRLGEHCAAFVDNHPRLVVAWVDHELWHDVVLVVEDGAPVAALVRVEPARWIRHGWSDVSLARVWR